MSSPGNVALMALGYYSLVQYVENIERGEPLNVGVIVTSSGSVEWAFSERPELDDPGIVHRFAETIAYVFGHELSVEPQAEQVALHELANRRFSHFVITEPRRVEVTSGISTTLESLRDMYASGVRHHSAFST